ncbi:protein kinase [Nonomuraea sp. NPDC049758]|uniref:protein kinase domain-containing protein n=1 Tax=Nonomuraea sp. NPDC049758 TaxID=3154360 RepID=UPI0034473812
MSELHADDPRQLGEYRISRRLGQGGQGVVFLGHSAAGGQVAIKLLHASVSKDADVRRRFLGEVEAVRRVAAFCTAQLLDADLDGDRPYLVSEYVEGPSLGEHVMAGGPRRGGSLDRLAIGTATALGAIHRAGVVHRDLKPGNVLLSLDGPRVIDFGVSRLMDAAATTTRSPIGTPAYLSPERISGEAAGPPADMWAWGLTVAYTAGGRHAYMADTYQEVLARILYGKPDLRGLSGRLREIVEACLAHDPRDRPDAEETLRALLGQDGGTGDVLPSGAQAAAPAPPPPFPLTTSTPDRTPTTAPRPSPEDAPATVPWPPTEGPRTPAPRPSLEPTPPTTPWPSLERPYASAPGGASTASLEGTPAAAASPPGGTPAVAAGGPSFTSPGGTPAVAGRRAWRRWQVVVAVAGVAVGVAGFVFWLRASQGPGLDGTVKGTAEHTPTTGKPDATRAPLDGTWTGSAEHPTAGRVFPVELRLRADGASTMRWGADLHCSGRLTPTRSAVVFALGQVKGQACHAGTVRIVPSDDPNRFQVKVTRSDTGAVMYSGRLSRAS